jgi:hypothetical protein
MKSGKPSRLPIFLWILSVSIAACGGLSARAPRRTVTAPIALVRLAFVGEGSLEAHGEKTAKTRLALERLAISADTSGDVAETTVEHVFRNGTEERLEGTFRFPLPEGAMITGLALEIDGKLVDGELVERDKARKAYEDVVDQMLDPALLEWEGGQTFKLRVFPIEPEKTKRVVLRFVAPLYRSNVGLFFAFRPLGSDGGVEAERTSIKLNGRVVDPRRATRASTGELLVRVADVAPDTVSEATKDGTYLHVQIRPLLADAPAPRADTPEAMILLCDRSRSMLEARSLQARIAAMLLDGLTPRDKFAVVAGDVRAHALAGGLHRADADDKAAAVAFLDADEPDGASDLAQLLVAGGAAARQARTNGLEPVVVYLGDASPTWGETRATRLAGIAKDSLAGATLHVVLIGKSTDDSTARALADAAHGRLLRPKTEAEARRAAEQVAYAAGARRIDDVRLVGADGADVPLAPPSTIYEGDDLELSLFVPNGVDLPALSLSGVVAGKPFARPIALVSAAPARHVAQRWAAAKIEELERDGDAHKDQVVATSLDHGVMSRYTSLLVLESEEAYERMQIARKSRQVVPADTRISGRDLDSADGQSPSVSPDHLQPGDPEVRVPAPADAQSVVVVFPFGETKTATFEPDERGGTWVTRFLVDRRTPDGTYEIVVRITHRDGHVEITKLSYVVDTQRPHLRVVVARKGGAYEIRATQELTAEEIAAQVPSFNAGDIDAQRQRLAHILTDAKRVEVSTPDGQVLSLVHVRLGEFLGTWTPRAALAARSRIHVVAVDRALNESEMDVEIP